MRLQNPVLLLCLCLTALVACGDGSPPADAHADAVVVADYAVREPGPDAQPPVDAQPAAPVTEAGQTVGGDGSEITLQSLGREQLDGVDLHGELACSFADADGATLLLARADVVPDGIVRGAVNNNGYLELLGNGRAGGFNDLSDGITLSGKGLTLELQRGESRPTGDETTQHAATLVVQRADGAERSYDGTLTCGP